MNKRIFLIISLLIAFTISSPIFAADKSPTARYNSLLKQAKAGDAKAMFLVARMIERGKGTNKDINKASKWYQRSASENYAAANARLGKMYLEGITVNKNHKKAFSLLNLAAIQGIPIAQFNLALLYELGIGTQRDLQEAIKWYDNAANSGYFSAKLKSQNLKKRLGVINNAITLNDDEPDNQDIKTISKNSNPQATEKISIAAQTTSKTQIKPQKPKIIKDKTIQATAVLPATIRNNENEATNNTQKQGSEELALLSNSFDRDELSETRAIKLTIQNNQQNSDPVKRQQIKQALLTLLTGRWFDKNRPTIFLPSPKAQCNIINKVELKCISRELQRHTEKETIFYKTLSKISKLNNHGNFVIQYQNTIVRVTVDKKVTSDSPNFKSKIKTGLQKNIHQLNCQYKDKSNLVCIKDNSEKFSFQNRAVINE